MKKFFVAVCCTLMLGGSVIAQEEGTTTPPAAPVVETAVQEVAPIADNSVPSGSILQGATVPGSTFVVDPMTPVYSPATTFVVPVQGCSGCGNNTVVMGQPVMQDSVMSTPVGQPVYNNVATPCTSCGQAAPVCDACDPCNSGRRQVVRGVFGRVRNIGSRRNNGCCN